MWSLYKSAPKKRTLEESLTVFSSCGVRLNEGITVDDLLYSNSRETYEQRPLLLAIHLGATVEKPPFPRVSDQLWHFDTECIEDHGAYVHIAERMRDLASGHLPVFEIKDYVDVEEQRAELSFKVDGEEVNWTLAVDNDWVDSTIFGRFVDLLRKRTTSQRFTYMDLGGQNCLIGFATDEQRRKLNSEFGLNFIWLK